MVHPVVNAFTACEPGILTKSLSQMNNFVSYGTDTRESCEHSTQYQRRPSQVAHVTPETKSRSGTLQSPQSSLSTNSPDSFSPKKTVSVDVKGQPLPSTSHAANDKSGVSSGTRKRSHSHFAETTLGFQPHFLKPLTLRPEHYRAVSRMKDKKGKDDARTGDEYQYVHVPLTFNERKRLSDTLFLLSSDIPTMSQEIAVLLRRARERQEWDFAVAELLTQVVVSRYCREGDHRLDGLQAYLLRMGISC